MLDDETGEALMQRKDDTKDALQARLKAYHEMTTPLQQHYKDVLATIDANKPMDQITPQILNAIERFVTEAPRTTPSTAP